MAHVINRNDMTLLRSVHTPDYQDPPWMIVDDYDAVAAIPQKYRKIVDDAVQEMDQTEKDAVDAAIHLAIKTASVDDVIDQPQSYDLVRALALLVLDELNRVTGALNDVQTDVVNICNDPQVDVTPGSSQLSERTASQIKTGLKAKMD